MRLALQRGLLLLVLGVGVGGSALRRKVRKS